MTSKAADRGGTRALTKTATGPVDAPADFRGFILLALKAADNHRLTVRTLEDEVSKLVYRAGWNAGESGARFDFSLETLMHEYLVEVGTDKRIALSRIGWQLMAGS